ncbi:FtsX-like permease family protein [Noviherbaspirillum soli]|uniref:FtsX-like permease family protein n=1 Tax=Noviherbaspirillum soli TaxID=1064518 RepID=UPI00188DBBB6|nr:FtsX-like permease family protein [Noviherbaspirillum soli]
MNALLARWLLAGEWRMHPVRALVAMGAIALGVALGFAIHLINAAAFNEFTAAVKSVSGVSDLQVRGAQATFDEALFPRLAQREGVTLASPVLEVDATVPQHQGTLKILGVDVFRAAAIAPDLVGVPQPGRAFDTLMDDTIFLSPAAMAWLEVKAGDMLTLRSGTADIRLRVAGGLVRARSGQRIAVMDIAAAQWRFDRLGKLSRIELKLAPGIDRQAFRAGLQRELGAALLVTETEDQEARSNNMSRAYRVNLNVLALVALFTGAFLVFSTQALSVIRRRQQFALLRVLGSSRRQVLAQVLAEGALLGVAGSLLGLLLGYALAALALRAFGGDLGGGYFPGVQPSVRFQPLAALVFFLAGSGIAILGSASPAWEAARARPAPALKAGSEDVALARLARPWPALACLLLGAALTRLPPVHGLPIFGYLAVALLLIGGIALMPRFAAWVFNAAAGLRARRGAVGTLALARLANAPNQASIALGGVLSSFALMVAMAIMVASFRVSVDDWLRHILSADLYVRSPAAADAGGLGPDQQRRIAALPGVLRADFQRVTPLALDPAQPSVALIARPIDAADPGRTLPLTGPSVDAGTARPVWVSEAMVDLYGYRVGSTITLPISGSPQPLLVAGVWRDYARQSGAIQMRLSDYQALTGDMTVNDAALWLKPQARASDVAAAVRALPFGAALELAEPGEIRALSLKIFDRSFAITYLLEAVAIIIGLFGVAATFSAQTMARAREFGMLRHIGVTRRQVLAMLATEGALLTAAGIAVGFLLGWCISLILVFIVNPQSFHWTMQLHMPWPTLATAAAALLASAAATALVAGRQAVSGDAVRAVREDW